MPVAGSTVVGLVVSMVGLLALVIVSRFGKAYLEIRKEERVAGVGVEVEKDKLKVEKKKIEVEKERVKVERLRVEAGKEVEMEKIGVKKIRVKGEVAVPGAQMEAEEEEEEQPVVERGEKATRGSQKKKRRK